MKVRRKAEERWGEAGGASCLLNSRDYPRTWQVRVIFRTEAGGSPLQPAVSKSEPQTHARGWGWGREIQLCVTWEMTHQRRLEETPGCSLLPIPFPSWQPIIEKVLLSRHLFVTLLLGKLSQVENWTKPIFFLPTYFFLIPLYLYRRCYKSFYLIACWVSVTSDKDVSILKILR